MVSYLSWTANAVLFVAACFLLANTANTIFAAVLAPAPTVAAEAVERVARQSPSWADRQVILQRNLFNSSTMEEAEPTPIEEDIEETKLPLDLLGTAAAEDPTYAWAAVLDREKRETLVVTIGDSLKGKATVERIERKRIVLLENGAYRELTIGEEAGIKAAVRAAARAKPPRPARRPNLRNRGRNQVRKEAENRYALDREAVEDALRDPTDILSQARFLPKYDGGQMIGFQVNSIKAGSVLKDFGIENGDVITEFNGIEIDSPAESARMLQEFNDNSTVFLVVDRNGETIEKTVELD